MTTIQRTLLALATGLTVAAGPAVAAFAGGGAQPVGCGDSVNTVSSPGYALACQGPLAGSLTAGQPVDFGGTLFQWIGASADGSGTFTADPGPAGYGTLGLGGTRTDAFVIGLQAGGSYSLYRFDGSAGAVSGLDFDTFGIARSGPQLTQAVLFAAVVPEPGTVGLWGTGLAAIALLARRRRQSGTSSQR